MKRLLVILAIVIAIVLIVAVVIFTTQKNDDKMMDDKPMATEEHSDDTMDKDNMEEKDMDKDNMDQKDDMDENKDMDSEDEMMDDNFLNVTMMDVDGNEWNLAKLGKKAVVKVWASWCPICVSGIDEFEEFTSTYEDAVVLSLVTPGQFGEMGKDEFIAWFKSLEGVENMVVILDEEGILVNELGIRGFPSYVYLNSKAEVHSTAIGHQATSDVISELEGIS